MKGRRLNALADSPVNRTCKNSGVILIHAKDEAAVDHHPQVVQAADRRAVIAVEILVLMLRGQVAFIQRLKADKETAQPTRHCFF